MGGQGWAGRYWCGCRGRGLQRCFCSSGYRLRLRIERDPPRPWLPACPAQRALELSLQDVRGQQQGSEPDAAAGVQPAAQEGAQDE